MKKYNHKAVEKKWQQIWQDEKTWEVDDKSSSQNYYVLDMFPYPSAEGLHVGHPEGYTASDIMTRYLAMKGKNVLHPMGFDSFGLPAENYAIKTGTHPSKTTAKNIANMRQQIKSLGFAYDWSREVITSDPKYYRWTQWIFIKLFKKGLAYEAKAPINWCTSCKTGLANEEVVDGKCERCGSIVTKKKIKQWLVKITDEKYIERLLNDLDNLDWPESIKQLQRNWIGRSEGAEVDFKIATSPSTSPEIKSGSAQGFRNDIIKVFTTRPDTLFGATYMVLSPEHELVDKITTKDKHKEVHAYQKQALAKSDLERTDLAKDKTGVFIGAYAINPVNNEKIPIWIADYVLISYGTGAIMAVPAHDLRDWEFAKRFDLPIVEVVQPPSPSVPLPDGAREGCYESDGVAINSGEFNGLKTEEFKKKITAWLEKNRKGKIAVNYKLRDWLFSRQRYWGEPIPIVHCESCKEDNKKTVLIIHGTGGDGRKNWNGWLSDKLRLLGHEVIAPDLPNTNQPVFEEWMEILDKYVNKLDENSIVIGHSLGGHAALQLVSKLKNKIGKLILVAPTSNKMDWKEFAKEHPSNPAEYQDKFHHQEVLFSNINKNSKEIIYFYSDNDAYISLTIPAYFKTVLEADFKLLKRRNHFTIKNGKAYTFPELFEEIVGKTPSPVGQVAVPEKDLPVELPKVKKYEPTGTGESPLASIDKWVNTKCPECGGKAKRETNTMPQWAGSNWYFLRYCDPHNDKQLADPEKLKAWLPVNLYIGGAEHAVLHLLYARFIYKFLFDIGVVPKEVGDEPFKKLKNQGLIMGEDGVKMSKSRGNVINPDDVIKEYGADTMRMYEMFMGPFEDSKPWSTKSIIGVKRFLDRVWDLQNKVDVNIKPQTSSQHVYNSSISSGIERFRFNTCISDLMKWSNEWKEADKISKEDFEVFIKLLYPFAPHVSEEIWENIGNKKSIAKEKWPIYDKSKIQEETVTIVVQVNGKLRDSLDIDFDSSEEEVKKLSMQSEKIKKYVIGEPKKVIFVKNKLINFVV